MTKKPDCDRIKSSRERKRGKKDGKRKNVTITMDDVNFNYKNVTISIKEHNICLVIDNDIIEEAVKKVLTAYGIWE